MARACSTCNNGCGNGVSQSRRADPVEDSAEPALIAMAMQRNIPLVATNPAYFADADFHPWR